MPSVPRAAGARCKRACSRALWGRSVRNRFCVFFSTSTLTSCSWIMPHNRQGFLVVEYPGSHDKYEGEWVLGKKEGKGRYTSNTGGCWRSAEL